MFILRFYKFFVLFILLNFFSYSPSIAATIDFRENFFSHDGVIVRVWRGSHTGGHHVGHVSLETRNSYISLWPDRDPSLPDVKPILEKGKPITTVNSSRFNTFEQDIISEAGRDSIVRYPDQTIPILNIGWADINARYAEYQEALREKKLRWIVSGPYLKIGETSCHSCSSLIYELLTVGRISEHLPLKMNYNPGVPITPDYVAELAGWAGLYSFSVLSEKDPLHADFMLNVISARSLTEYSLSGVKLSHSAVDLFSYFFSCLNKTLPGGAQLATVRIPNGTVLDNVLEKISRGEWLKRQEISTINKYIASLGESSVGVLNIAFFPIEDLIKFEFHFTTSGERCSIFSGRAASQEVKIRTKDEIGSNPLYKLRKRDELLSSFLSFSAWYRFFSKPRNYYSTLAGGTAVAALGVAYLFYGKELLKY